MTSSNPSAIMWEERYGDEEFAFGKEPNDFLKETVPSLGLSSTASASASSSSSSSNIVTKKCLMLADGEGRNGVYMAEECKGWEIVSVDFSQAGLDKAKALAESRSVSLTTVLADLGEYDFGSDEWDCIVGIFCHFPPPIRAKILKAIPESLRQGGYFILECYTPDQIPLKTGGPKDPEMTFSKQILADALDGHLETIRNEELVRYVVEGRYHSGKAAVVQYIGRKTSKN